MEFTKTEFDTIKNVCNVLKEKKFFLERIQKNSMPKAYTNPIDWYGDEGKVLREIITPKLEAEVGKFKMGTAFVLEAYEPWDIHSDARNHLTGEFVDNPKIICLIPLEEVDSHTVVFVEEWSGEFSDYRKENEPHTDKLSDFSEELYNNHLTHLHKDHLKWLTLQSVNKWEIGKPIIFNRRLLHCSDDFKKHNIESKSALILFTEDA